MPALCDICQERPATSRVTVVQNGQRKTIDICDYDYRQLMRHQNIMNPFDSLLGRGGLSGFFNGFGNNTRGRDEDDIFGEWIGPYISRHFLSLNPLLVRRRRYSRGERYPSALCGCHSL